MSPLAIGSARLLIGSLILWIISLRVKNSKRFPRSVLWICALGVAAYQLAFFSAVHLTGVAIATVTALGSSPVFTGIFSWISGHERPSRTWLLATTITTIGIITLNANAEQATFNFAGVLLALCAGAGFASFNVAGRSILKSGYPMSHFVGKSFALAAMLLSPFLFVGSHHWMSSAKNLSLLLWLGIIATALAYSLYSYGLTHLKASNASTLVLAEPVTATLLSVTVLHNHLTTTSWVGVFIVIAGLLYLGIKG